jgi:hypothetical protein
MVSSYVLTQKDLEGRTDPARTVGLAGYGVDDWPYATVVEDGKVALQGVRIANERNELSVGNNCRIVYFGINGDPRTPKDIGVDGISIW